MSNDVVILLLDGPAHGLQMQSPRPVPATIPVVEPDATYIPRIHTDNQWNYRVALPADTEFTEDTINMHIAAFGLQPAWDLNPPFRQTAP